MPKAASQSRAVIFDLDGVLVDSYRAHWQSWQFMADELGKGLTEAQFASTFGRTSREIIAAHWGRIVFLPPRLRISTSEKKLCTARLSPATFRQWMGRPT